MFTIPKKCPPKHKILYETLFAGGGSSCSKRLAGNSTGEGGVGPDVLAGLATSAQTHTTATVLGLSLALTSKS